MTPADEYVFKAAQLSALAEEEINSELRSELRKLAETCFRLADRLHRRIETEAGHERPSYS